MKKKRVAKMRGRNDALGTDERALLFDLGISKNRVLQFWSEMPFDLGLPEHMGNCTGCFLKDERDLADALVDEETDAQWWIDIEENYAPMRRGRSSYRQVRDEAPERHRIRAAIQRGEDVRPGRFESSLPWRRVRLIVAQEHSARVPFSCECDAAKADDFDDQLELGF
jgi:hypothetical protein